ncbi:hypothetical protein AB0J86_16240 [Micromonospora sp. NPDC049559]|uniref:hypothetical protein n=1 Tax=Micromonospora sp. NPDC049559 TaxID=3155923 RepID=UPI0034226E4A
MYYSLTSPLQRRVPDLFDFVSARPGRSHEGVRRRIFETLVLGRGDARFLAYTTVVVQAQEGITPELIADADYLPTVAGPPVFSAAFAEATRDELRDELDCHPCLVRCGGTEFGGFVVARVRRFLPLVDPERSEYWTGATGTPLLRTPVYRPELAESFHLARDVDHPEVLVCGPRLVRLVESKGLRILFDPA